MLFQLNAVKATYFPVKGQEHHFFLLSAYNTAIFRFNAVNSAFFPVTPVFPLLNAVNAASIPIKRR